MRKWEQTTNQTHSTPNTLGRGTHMACTTAEDSGSDTGQSSIFFFFFFFFFKKKTRLQQSSAPLNKALQATRLRAHDRASFKHCKDAETTGTIDMHSDHKAVTAIELPNSHKTQPIQRPTKKQRSKAETVTTNSVPATQTEPQPPRVAAVDFKKMHSTQWSTVAFGRLYGEQDIKTHIQLLTILYDQQRSTVHTDVRSKHFHLKRGTKQGDPLSTLLLNPLLQHLMKSTARKVEQSESDLLSTTQTRTSPISGSQTTSLSSAAYSSTRPPCWTTTPRPQRHTAWNNIPLIRRSSPTRHHNPEQVIR